MVASLRFKKLGTYSVRVVWLRLSAKQRTYSTDCGQTLLRFHPAQSGEMDTEGGDAKLHMDVSWYGFTSLEAVPIGTTVSHIFSRSV